MEDLLGRCDEFGMVRHGRVRLSRIAVGRRYIIRQCTHLLRWTRRMLRALKTYNKRTRALDFD